ncbi:MAG: hypothetical protein R2856_26065 [Caldilineaceae bacterium]
MLPFFCGGAWLWWTQAPAVVEAEVRTPQPYRQPPGAGSHVAHAGRRHIPPCR